MLLFEWNIPTFQTDLSNFTLYHILEEQQLSVWRTHTVIYNEFKRTARLHKLSFIHSSLFTMSTWKTMTVIYNSVRIFPDSLFSFIHCFECDGNIKQWNHKQCYFNARVHTQNRVVATSMKRICSSTHWIKILI